MFDNLIMSEIKNDIISFLPAGAPYHETSIMALWKNLHSDGDYVSPRGKFKNKEYELKCSEDIKAIIKGMSFDNLILFSSNVISSPMALLQFFKKRGWQNNTDNVANIILVYKNFNNRVKLTEKKYKEFYYDYKLRAEKRNISTTMSLKDYKEMFKLVNLYEFDQNWIANEKEFSFSGELLETVRILSNDVLATKDTQIKFCKYIYQGKKVADVFDNLKLSRFNSQNEDEYIKSLQKVRIALIKKNDPLSSLCAIEIGKDTRYSSDAIRKNDVNIENQFIFRLLISHMLSFDSVSGDYVIIGASPFLVKKISKYQELLKKVKITFVCRNEDIRDIMNIQFKNPDFSGITREEYTFISLREFEETLSQEGAYRYSESVIFANEIGEGESKLLLDRVFEKINDNQQFLIASSDAMMNNIVNVSSKYDNALLDNILIMPSGIDKSKTHKMIICSINGSTNQEKDKNKVNIRQAFLANTKNDIQQMAISSKKAVADINDIEYGISLRKLYDNIINEHAKKQKRNPKRIYEFSPEINISFNASGGENEDKVRVQAYIYEPVVCINEGVYFLGKGNVLEESKKAARINPTDLERWLTDVYPFSSPSNKNGIRNVISKAYREVYKEIKEEGQIAISVRTFWYIFEEIDERLSTSESVSLKQMALGRIGELNIVTATAQEYETLLLNCYPNDTETQKLSKLNILSVLLDFACESGFARVNTIDEAIQEGASENKIYTIRKNLVKRTLSANEFVKAEDEILKLIEEGKLEYVALLIKLYTGIETNIVSALIWDDFIKNREYDFYQLQVYRQTQNDGKSYRDLQNKNKIRLVPCTAALANVLVKMLDEVKKEYPQDYKRRHIVPVVEGADYDICFPPRNISKMCRNILKTIGIDDEIIIVPDNDKGTVETNLTRYCGDILRTNFEYYARTVAAMNIDEICYLMGNEPKTVIGKNYVSLIDDPLQYIMHIKMQRMYGVLHKSSRHLSVELTGAVKSYNVSLQNDEVLLCRIKKSNPEDEKEEITISSKHGIKCEITVAAE